ncbi:MAG: hypothetical protein NC930_02550 [Candidatus Omnitrophica bacterium]|nr:hypothetical protein [Candidatus Omnitrophota bacterium]
MKRQSMSRVLILFMGVFLTVVFSRPLAPDVFAMEIVNKSEDRISVIILEVQEERNQPLLFKTLNPRETAQYELKASGSLVISLVNLDTKQGTRLGDIQADEKIVYDGRDLKKDNTQP